jgi:hypothetical protein
MPLLVPGTTYSHTVPYWLTVLLAEVTDWGVRVRVRVRVVWRPRQLSCTVVFTSTNNSYFSCGL